MRFSRSVVVVFASFLIIALSTAHAEDFTKPGTRIDLLPAGKNTYRDVVVRSVNARTLMITHAGGMTSIRLRDLSPEWQAHFNYDPAAEQTAENAAATAPAKPPTPHFAKTKETQATKFEKVLKEFGQPATLQSEIDLRPKFFQMDLWVKNQGFRPSCAIFAVVSALEFQNAEVTGKAEKFSEEYLIWATQKSLHRPAPAAPNPADDATAPKENRDVGYALSEVIAALRAYGIPLQTSMPNTIGLKISEIPEPTPEIINEAKNHQHVYVYPVPGRDPETGLNNIILALNRGIPVVIGLGWPNIHTLKNAYLSEQKPLPDSGHAVTLVGYRCASGRMEDAVFIFKNSWGKDWGQGGYGIATYGYLKKSIHSAVILDVQRS